MYCIQCGADPSRNANRHSDTHLHLNADRHAHAPADR